MPTCFRRSLPSLLGTHIMRVRGKPPFSGGRGTRQSRRRPALGPLPRAFRRPLPRVHLPSGHAPHRARRARNVGAARVEGERSALRADDVTGRGTRKLRRGRVSLCGADMGRGLARVPHVVAMFPPGWGAGRGRAASGPGSRAEGAGRVPVGRRRGTADPMRWVCAASRGRAAARAGADETPRRGLCGCGSCRGIRPENREGGCSGCGRRVEYFQAGRGCGAERVRARARYRCSL